MKELIFHRMFLPAVERWPTRSGSTTATTTPRSREHADRVLRLADAHAHASSGSSRGDRFAVMACNSHQYLELYHAGVPRRGRDQPAQPAPRRQGAAVHPAPTPAPRSCSSTRCSPTTSPRSIAEVRDELPLAPRRADRRRRRARTTSATRTCSPPAQPSIPDEPEEDDPVVLMYTGGTTGSAQGRAARPARRDAEPVPHRPSRSASTSDACTCTRRRCSTPRRWAAILGIPAIGGTSVVRARCSSRRR